MSCDRLDDPEPSSVRHEITQQEAIRAATLWFLAVGVGLVIASLFIRGCA